MKFFFPSFNLNTSQIPKFPVIVFEFVSLMLVQMLFGFLSYFRNTGFGMTGKSSPLLNRHIRYMSRKLLIPGLVIDDLCVNGEFSARSAYIFQSARSRAYIICHKATWRFSPNRFSLMIQFWSSVCMRVCENDDRGSCDVVLCVSVSSHANRSDHTLHICIPG